MPPRHRAPCRWPPYFCGAPCRTPGGVTPKSENNDQADVVLLFTPTSTGRSEIAPPQRVQPLPMPLRRVLVVGGALWEGEAVFDLGAQFDFGVEAFEPLAQRRDLLDRHPVVDLGAGEIKLGLFGLVRHEVRA